MKTILLILSAGLAFKAGTLTAAPLGTAFTYQGGLNDGANPAQGIYDLRFTIYDSPAAGVVVSGPVTNAAAGVTNGLFTVTLDFGEGVFDGDARWLEIGVRTNGAASFTALAPRQPLTPAPYALSAGSLSGTLAAAQLTGALPSAQLAGAYGSPVTFNNGMNTFNGTFAGDFYGFNFVGGGFSGSFFGDGNGLYNLNASQLAGGTVPGARLGGSVWLVGGNAGTTPGTNFIGTTDNRPLEFKVNGSRVMRLEPETESPTIIAGHPDNTVAADISGATISGGGNPAEPNVVMGRFGTISGGVGNVISTNAGDTTIGGGWLNRIEAYRGWATIGGGSHNVADAVAATVSGGYGNAARGEGAVIAGAFGNTVESYASVISGGAINFIGTNSSSSVIGGGSNNNIGDFSRYTIIAGGRQNNIGTNSSSSFVGGGYDNYVGDCSDCSSISGGDNNNIGTHSHHATIGGGKNCVISDSCNHSTISGGIDNWIGASSGLSVVAGGSANKIGTNSALGVVGGGFSNEIGTNSYSTTIGGGYNNSVGDQSDYATIGGGERNTVANNSDYSALGGGRRNSIGTNSMYSTIGGGYTNKISDNAAYAIIPGGRANTATNYAFAAGYNAQAANIGAFVWSDGTGTATSSTNINSVTMRAGGGYRFFTGTGTSGAFLTAGGGSWTSMSDRNSKENFTAVNPGDVLAKVAALPMSTWNYKSQDASTRHMGPMAQDFKTAFGLGESDTGITGVDADGVALAAIQGLNQKLEEQKAENAELKQRLERLEQLLARQNGGAR